MVYVYEWINKVMKAMYWAEMLYKSSYDGQLSGYVVIWDDDRTDRTDLRSGQRWLGDLGRPLLNGMRRAQFCQIYSSKVVNTPLFYDTAGIRDA